jgi:lipid-A-disaccharide synthase
MSRIYMIAGEASGDQLGGWLMEALLQQHPSIEISGIGGSAMQAQGLTTLFPMQHLSLMGFAEVIPHIFTLKKYIKKTVEHIEKHKPDVVVTIDSPGFNFRVINALKARAIVSPKYVHYVAPTVWAYKPERAKKTAALCDGLMVLLPFEPPYFEANGLKTQFIGHPIAWWWRDKGDGVACRKRHGIDANAPVLALFPGSRNGEIARHMPLFRQTVARLKEAYPLLESVILLRPENQASFDAYAHDWPCPLHIVTDTAQKKDVFAASNAALAKSGTISLECALAGLPSVTVYKTHPISAWYIRNKLRTPFVNLANILSRKEIIPEFLQEAATPEAVARALAPVISGDTSQRQRLSIIPAMLGANEAESPSQKAAKFISEYL